MNVKLLNYLSGCFRTCSTFASHHHTLPFIYSRSNKCDTRTVIQVHLQNMAKSQHIQLKRYVIAHITIILMIYFYIGYSYEILQMKLQPYSVFFFYSEKCNPLFSTKRRWHFACAVLSMNESTTI